MTPSTFRFAKALGTRSLALAVASSFFGLAACTFLLDTESLQKKGAGASSGIDASTPPADASGDGATKSCQSDLDCQPDGTVNGCFSYTCGPDKICLPPQPYSGLAVESSGDVEVAVQANEIGHPSLLADQTDIVLSAWRRNGTDNDVVIRRYDERPTISPVTADLTSIAPGRFDAIASSAGMTMRSLPRRVRLLFAGRLMGATSTAMYQADVDMATLKLSATASQPSKSEVGVTGYDTSPRGPVPRLFTNGLQEPNGMWVQQGKLLYFDGTNATEAYTDKRVVGFALIGGAAGVHAALETTDITNPMTQGSTSLWTRGVPALTSLVGDSLGAQRRGVAAITMNEGPSPLNFIVWAFERAGAASMLYAGAVCDLNTCTAASAPTMSGATLPAAFPEASSARVSGSMTDRDLGAVYQITAPDPDDATMSHSVLIGGISRLTTPQGDAGRDISSKAMNPPNFIVGAVKGPASAAPGDTLGPSAVAMTANGVMMVAWVERGPMNLQLLKTRRFAVKTCPAP